MDGLRPEAFASIEVTAGEPRDVRKVTPVGGADGGEDPPVGSDVVEAGIEIADREDGRGPVLADPYQHAVGELAAHAGRAYPGASPEACLGRRHVDPPHGVSLVDS